MSHFDLRVDYLNKVCSQIRWKRAHDIVRRELGDHISDQQDRLFSREYKKNKRLRWQ